MVQVEHVYKSFGQMAAVADVSFEVAAGETLVLLGSSGSGKTTTLKMLNRLVEPSAGKIWIDGKDIVTQPIVALRRKIGYVIQQIGLFPHYTVEENIGLIPGLLQWPESKIKQRTHLLLETVGLPEHFIRKYPHELSGGQQQRVGLARALAANPPIILMDEPFGALDPIIRQSIRQEFLQLDELKDKTTILVTHDVTEAIQLADRICLMDNGRIQQIGSAKELLLNPANAFVQEFFNHNRFQLELMVQTLIDILPEISTTELPSAMEVPVFAADANLWNVVNKLQEVKKGEQWFGIKQGSVIYYTKLSKALIYKNEDITK
jgi:osmoprotectant transport system ATP-binding protein